MKLLMAGALAFVLSLAVATGLTYKGRKAGLVAAEARADSLRADSLRADSLRAASRPGSRQGAAPDSSAHTGGSAVAGAAATPTVHAKVADGRGAVAPELPGVTAAKAARSPAASMPAALTEEQAAAFKQLGKIFGSMKPDDAGKVLGFLSDEEVEGVLRQLNAKQAAGILSSLPSQRAGAISRRLLVAKSGGTR